MNTNFIKTILAILFFLCLLNMPYGFYQFVRFAGLIGFVFLAYETNGNTSGIRTILIQVIALMPNSEKPKETLG